MKWDEIAKLPRETLLVLLEDSLRNILRVDGYWFQAGEKLVGMEPTLKMDEEVWGRFGRAAARMVKKTFKLEENGGIPSLIQAINLDPMWTFFGELDMKQLSESQLRLQVTSCFSQKERLRLGQDVFPCRPVEETYFNSFAQAIDPRVKVRYGFCPPEKYSENLWCEWYFETEDSK
jgi:hypothetical protein